MLRSHYNRGQSILIAVVLFLVISLTIVIGITNPVLSQVKASREFVESQTSYVAAEAGTEDALYRIKNSISISPSETLTVGSSTVITTISDSVGGKTITSDGGSTYVRKVETKVETGEGLSFTYALQVGSGGFDIDGGSTVNGNIYANGNVTGDGGSTVTGSVTAANSSALLADQTNNTPSTPSNSVDFGRTSGQADFAQSFQVSSTGPLNKVRVYLKKTSTPGNLTVRIVSDNSGVPSSSTFDSATLSSGSVGTSYGWIEVVFGNYIQLEAGTTYWLVLDGGNNSTRYYTIGANSGTYTSGTGKLGSYGGSWGDTSPSGLDGYFEVYMGGIVSQIAGDGGSWDLAIGGTSWAHTVNNTNTTGIIYCQTGTGNAGGKACNTSRSDPSPQAFPISDANVQEWKDDVTSAIVADGWTHTGNLTIGWQGTTTSTLRHINGNLTVNGGGVATFGALEVNGNVTISGGATLAAGPLKVNGNLTIGSTGITVKGTVWVTGTISVASGAVVRLASTYATDSGIILAEGPITVNGGADFSGSGQSGSYPIVVSVSSCPTDVSCAGANALSINGGAGAVVLMAPYGTLSMAGGTSAKAMTSYRMVLSGGASVTYDSGLVDTSISSGPSGSWNISSWKEIQ